MVTRETVDRLVRYALFIGVLAFAASAVPVITGHRTFFNWLLLGGTFGNILLILGMRNHLKRH